MHDVLARGLLQLGIFRAPAGASEEEAVKTVVEKGLTSAFYPHGVGASYFTFPFLSASPSSQFEKRN
jgi:hypothetical protein